MSAPKERPILFSAPMVRANRAGRKSQTRRLMNPQPVPIPPDVKRVKPYDDTGFEWACSKAKSMISLYDAPCASPYGNPGDRLWVRETWRADLGWRHSKPSEIAKGATIWYEADGAGSKHERGGIVPWYDRLRPSIFLPRWASRDTYEVTEVRVQRLQDISEEDAKAEGLTTWQREDGGPIYYGIEHADVWELDPRATYRRLWDSINGERAPWESSPWVWAVSYKPVTP